MNKPLAFVVLVVLACLFMGSAGAAPDDDAPLLNDRFAIYLGGFFPQVKSEITINGSTFPGEGIDFENALGLEDSKSVLWGGVRWRISKRNSLEFEFADLNRNGSVTAVTDELEVGDSVIQAGARVDSTFDTTLGRLTYGFSVLKDEKKDLQLKAGLHIADMGVSLQATGAVCVAPEMPPNCSIFLETPRAESESITAPLPHFGFSFSYAFTPTIVGRFQLLGFAIELDSIDGRLVEMDADVVWSPWRHFGIGAGFRYFNANIESKGSDLNGEFDFEYYGPSLYGIFTF